MFQCRSPLAGSPAVWDQPELVSREICLFASTGLCRCRIFSLTILTGLEKGARIQAPTPSPLLAQALPFLPIFSLLSNAFLQDQTGPKWEDAVQVMFPGFSFLILDPEQVEEGAEGVLDPGGGVGDLLVDGAPSVSASTPSIVTSRSVLVE